MTSFNHTFEPVLHLPLLWHFCGLALVALLLFLNYKSKRGNILVIFLWNFIGVFLHEVSHLVVGIVLFAKPTNFSLIPHRKENGGYQLGSVEFRGLDTFNSLPVGLAPLVLLVAAYFIFTNWSKCFQPSLLSTLGIYFTSFVLIYNSRPSLQDCKIAFRLPSILFYGVVAVVVFFFKPHFRDAFSTWVFSVK